MKALASTRPARIRLLRWRLSKTNVGRALLVTEWLRGFDTGRELNPSNRAQRRAAARHVRQRRS